jgi:uncharacterized heparinase superfamily protein
MRQRSLALGKYALSHPLRSTRRVLHRLRSEAKRYGDVNLSRELRAGRMPSFFGSDPESLWNDLASRPHAAAADRVDPTQFEEIAPGEVSRVLGAAGEAVAHRVDLLGSGPIDLGDPIDWVRDYKTGRRWPQAYAPGHSYLEVDRSSDVKFPWEISRLHWLIPAAQAYRVTGDEQYARCARAVIEHWIAANPYAHTVNWAVAMEPALRILSWTWFFHVFAKAEAWSDPGFRRRFLAALLGHAHFVESHIEYSDVGGNHLIADATGLVFAGLFFGDHPRAQRWAKRGWAILLTESPRQINPDGVDFEASTGYHRLVSELLSLSALYRLRLGQPVGAGYMSLLGRMANFIVAYSRSDGSSPLWGDADDSRALPFGPQGLNDHRYLIGTIAWIISDARLARRFSGSRAEALWLGGVEATTGLAPNETREESQAFVPSGVYVMRHQRDHIFVDCGSVGMAGRGGHGHNDCLSFELMLDGALLVRDAGTFVYSASFEWRNRFRATASHNTPMIDGEEQNRFVHPQLLWALQNDAQPCVTDWRSTDRFDALVASHSGYKRLKEPVEPRRTTVYDKELHQVLIHDEFVGTGAHSVQIPIHFASGVELLSVTKDHAVVGKGGRQFTIAWGSPGDWSAQVRESWLSFSYGIKVPTPCLEFSRSGELRSFTLLAAVGAPLTDAAAMIGRFLARASDSLGSDLIGSSPSRGGLSQRARS